MKSIFQNLEEQNRLRENETVTAYRAEISNTYTKDNRREFLKKMPHSTI